MRLSWLYRRMPNHLEFEHWVPFPTQRVFAFFCDPENLPRIMPAASGAKLIALNRLAAPASLSPNQNKAAGVGSTIFTSFLLIPFFPFQKKWVSRITKFK